MRELHTRRLDTAVDGDGGALLGQVVLSKLRSWKIDNERQTLDIS